MRKLTAVLAVAALALVAVTAAVLLYRDGGYKTDFHDEVAAAAAEFSVPEELIFAVIKCESSFDPAAKSSSGAVGLMQLLPATFDEVAWRLGESPDASDIEKPEVSIRYGTFYLSYLIKYFKNEQTAIAAYNAGMGRVNSWLADSRYSDDGVTLKHIPYEETRNYVNKVQKAREKYKTILEGKQK